MNKHNVGQFMSWLFLSMGIIGFTFMGAQLVGSTLAIIIASLLTFAVYVELQYFSCKCKLFRKPAFCSE